MISGRAATPSFPGTAPAAIATRVVGESTAKSSEQGGLDPQSLKQKGRMAKIVEARDRFICEAVLEEGYLASELGPFLGYHPSNVSRVVQQGL